MFGVKIIYNTCIKRGLVLVSTFKSNTLYAGMFGWLVFQYFRRQTPRKSLLINYEAFNRGLKGSSTDWVCAFFTAMVNVSSQRIWHTCKKEHVYATIHN